MTYRIQSRADRAFLAAKAILGPKAKRPLPPADDYGRRVWR